MISSLCTYTFAASAFMAILWVIYRSILAKVNNFKANRMVLGSIYVAGWLLPVLISSLFPTQTSTTVADDSIIIETAHEAAIHLPSILSIMWLAGVIIVAGTSAREILLIWRLAGRSRAVEYKGRNIYLTTDKGVSPFSIGKFMVISEDDYKTAGIDMIIAHETGHMRLLHSLDVLLAQATCVFCWYNPAVWFLRTDLKAVHEYQADRYVLSHGYAPKAYQTFLVMKSAPAHFPMISNNFNHSQLRSRISMMNKPQWHRTADKVRYLAPIAGIAVCCYLFNHSPLKASIQPWWHHEEEATQQLKDTDIFIDGQEVPYEQLKEVATNKIKSITVSRNPNRIDLETKDE